MKTTLLIPVLLLFAMATYAQSLRKYPIGNSGCSVYTFCAPTFITNVTKDSAMLYMAECNDDDVFYGVDCVLLHDTIDDPDAAENLLIKYLDYLKSIHGISKSIGYGKGHQLNNNEQTRGVLDYWEDNEKNSWKIMGWTDGRYIGVLYAYSKQELPETKVNVFLNSFRLPE